MNLRYSSRFRINIRKLPKEVRDKFYKQAEYLLRDIRYPSLHAKKYDESQDIWQARVDKNYRFYFLIKDSIYFLLEIKRHPK